MKHASPKVGDIARSGLGTVLDSPVGGLPLLTVPSKTAGHCAPSKAQKAVLSRIAKRQAAGDDSGIDYSDIPPLTDEQLAQFRRIPKVLVAARIDKVVYDWLMQYGKGYSTRINSILRTVMERAR
jgi:uncharacterized protein (DUF4415 family)